MPENYLPEKTMDAQQNNDYLSDDSWGTDFEDEEPEGNSHFEEVVKPSQINNRQMISQNNINRIPMQSSKRIIKPEEEETYVNCESCQDEEENMYMNFQETMTTPPPPKNVSRLHNQIEKTLANKEIIKLNEELKRKNGQLTRKPTIGPKPETLPPRKISMTTISDKKLPQKSFLHTATNQRVSNEPQSKLINNSVNQHVALPLGVLSKELNYKRLQYRNGETRFQEGWLCRLLRSPTEIRTTCPRRPRDRTRSYRNRRPS